MSRRTLIISADDFGFSASVNEAVLRAAEFGTLGAASLMTNMPFAEEAVAAAKRRTPTLSFGLHFALTSGTACAQKDEVSLLVDGKGFFHRGFGGLLKLLRGKDGNEAKRQIQREFAAQLAESDRLSKTYGVEFDHLDSHQHVHVLPGIFEILAEASKQRNWTLRIPRERFGSFRRFAQRLFSWGAVGFLKREILKHCLPSIEGPDYFGILDTGKMDAVAWNAILSVLNRSVAEVNVHPSLDPGVNEAAWRCSEGDRIFHRSVWRRREFDAIITEEFRTRLRERNIIPGSFRQD